MCGCAKRRAILLKAARNIRHGQPVAAKQQVSKAARSLGADISRATSALRARLGR